MAELVGTLESIGFVGVEITHRFDPFAGTEKEPTTRRFGVQGVNVLAIKPE